MMDTNKLLTILCFALIGNAVAMIGMLGVLVALWRRVAGVDVSTSNAVADRKDKFRCTLQHIDSQTQELTTLLLEHHHADLLNAELIIKNLKALADLEQDSSQALAAWSSHVNQELDEIGLELRRRRGGRTPKGNVIPIHGAVRKVVLERK